MAWQDRLRDAAYTSPSGARLPFGYEDMRSQIDKKTTGFTFPDADGTFIQDLGHSGRRYPVRAIFWGADCDSEAAAFEAALLERGEGRLEHPMYGRVDVVPYGTISRRDDLKTAANQVIIEVAFWGTSGAVYPSSSSSPSSAVLSAVAEFATAAASSFSENVDLTSPGDKAVFRGQYEAELNSSYSTLSAVADETPEAGAALTAVRDSVSNSLDTLTSDPLTLAAQTVAFSLIPARATSASILDRLAAYQSALSGAIGIVGSINALLTADLFASSYVAGKVLSCVNTQFITKADALSAAEDVLDTMSELVTWRDDSAATVGHLDTGEAYQQLQEAVAMAAGFLVEISFTLKQERALILDRDRTIIDLVAELYGAVDSELDFFINSNNLSGSEILELPRGRRIVYYV